ncbi:hypothetical protein [Gluconobacter cerevisiae]|nr:hypothetical protein [Gluconobacter cerevisiae]
MSDEAVSSAKRSNAKKHASEGGACRITYGANQSEKVFTVPKPVEFKSGQSKLEQIGKECTSRESRSFDALRAEQTLRHLATATQKSLDVRNIKGYQEVQAGYKDGDILISTNTNQGNKALKNIFSDTDKKSQIHTTVSKFSENIAKEFPSSAELADQSVRKDRHIKKFADPIRIEASGIGHMQIIPTDSVSTARDGLHAERRILEAGGTDPVGIKRPCANCYPHVHPDAPDPVGTGPGPGPQWLSKSAQMGDTPASMGTTRITLARNNKMTVDYGSDSDSDA